MTDSKIVDYVRKSFELKNQGFYKQAIEMLYKALALDSDNLEILAQLAHLYKLLNNFERANYYIEKALEINPNHVDSIMLQEEIYLEQGFLQLAQNAAEKIYEIQPTNENLVKRIKILNKLQDTDAIKEIQETISDFNDELLYEIAYAYYENYDFDEAVKLLEQGYEKNNKNEKIMFLLGKIYYDKKDFEKALKFFSELEEINPTAQIMNYLGLIKLENKDLAKATAYFLSAQNEDSKNSEYAYNLGSTYFLNGWLEEALNFFNQAICLDPENIDYHYSIAYLYYQENLYEKAMSEVKFIETLEQHHEPTNVLMAMITAKQGDLLSAKNQLEKILKYNEDDFAYSALGQICKELAMYDSAKENIQHALKLNPNSLEYLSELAGIEIRQGKYDEAKNYVQDILKTNEKYVYAYVLLAKINLEKNNYEEVFENAQNIIELDSNCSRGYHYNAIALFEQGDKNFAIESLKKAISLDLNNPTLYIKMSEFYQELGDFENAFVWSKEANEIDERNYKYKWLCAKLKAALGDQANAVKYYSQSYRLCSSDKDLQEDYAKYLTSIGKEKQAKKILNK